jgi:hypothetical protein
MLKSSLRNSRRHIPLPSQSSRLTLLRLSPNVRTNPHGEPSPPPKKPWPSLRHSQAPKKVIRHILLHLPIPLIVLPTTAAIFRSASLPELRRRQLQQLPKTPKIWVKGPTFPCLGSDRLRNWNIFPPSDLFLPGKGILRPTR